ncbi:MAG: hypothetical protein KatS3mg002_0532 [Candidatus Woesearchaeota archaeon]|nr:MAG: hypothetical protein KatS3mg002_0532 [Candidatus Woesearchaeota archaeon]
MRKKFSKSWNSSKKPNKQRKFRYNAPLHIKGEFLNVHLSKDLRNKYKMRAVRVRVGDKVRILRGQFKKQEGKVEEVDVKRSVIYVSKIEHVKRDGTKARYPIQPSNVMIIELNTDDKKRFKQRNVTKKALSKDNTEDTKKETKHKESVNKEKTTSEAKNLKKIDSIKSSSKSERHKKAITKKAEDAKN